MALGPGIYDELASVCREATQARVILLAVLDGFKGTGFSIQTVEPAMLVRLPALLREMADYIEEDIKEVGKDLKL